MFKSSAAYFLFTGMVIPAILVLGYVFYQKHFQKLPVRGPYKVVKGQEQLIQTPDWTFTDQNNHLYSSDSLKNRIQVLNFFFTSCPTVCPKMNKNVQKVQQVFIDDPRIQFVSISVDPERDQPDKLKAYEEKFSLNPEQWHFLTGDKDSIYLLARKGYNLSATDADGSSQNIIHSQQVLLIDPNQQIRGIYNGTVDDQMANLVQDISKLKNELN